MARRWRENGAGSLPPGVTERQHGPWVTGAEVRIGRRLSWPRRLERGGGTALTARCGSRRAALSRARPDRLPDPLAFGFMVRRAAVLSVAVGLLAFLSSVGPAGSAGTLDGGSAQGGEHVALTRIVERPVLRTVNVKPTQLPVLVGALGIAVLAAFQLLGVRRAEHVRVAGPTWLSPIVGRAPPLAA